MRWFIRLQMAIAAMAFLAGGNLFGQIDKQTASKAALNFINERRIMAGLQEKDPSEPATIYTCSTGLTKYYYVVSYRNSGFVVVSACPGIRPVLAYSLDGRYSDVDQPPAFARWMKDYQLQIADVISGQTPADPEAPALWQKYMLPVVTPKSSVKQVLPLLHTTWNQGKYYNALCPPDAGGPGGRTWAGCVPTAMGQIMNYYRHPLHGTGSYTYVHPTYGTLSADFGNSTYYWNDMPVEVTGIQTDSAVARLLSHLGISVDLDYGPNGSGMFNHKAAYSLRTYFGYSPLCQYVFRDTAFHTNWKQLILDHLDQHRPLYYAGWADTLNISGHAFVCDGYQDTSYFHFNWGWGGSFDGYFMLDNLTPGGSDFTLDHELIINFFPDPAAQYPLYCNGTQTLGQVSGTLEDGSGPVFPYQNNSDCSWLIQPLDSVTNIRLTFLEFNTQHDSDRVIVYNGPTPASPVLGTYSGNTIPAVITSTSKSLLVRFVSSSDTVKPGWLAKYQSTLPVFCSGIKDLTASSGTFTDGSGSYNYHSNQLCRWRIQPPGASSLTIHFNDFAVSAGDYVNVYDMNGNVLLASLSGDSIPADITSPSGKMLIMFKTFENQPAQGFSATYGTSSAEEAVEVPDFRIYPNPARDEINIVSASETVGLHKVDIFSCEGVLCASWELQNTGTFEHTFSVKHLSPGLYIIRIFDNNHQTNQKIIVE